MLILSVKGIIYVVSGKQYASLPELLYPTHLNFEARLALGCSAPIASLTTGDFERIPGISYARATLLYSHKELLRTLSGEAFIEQILAIKGFGPVLSRRVHAVLSPPISAQHPACF